MTHRTEQCCKECSGWEPALHECSCQCHYSPTDEGVVSPTIPERVEEQTTNTRLKKWFEQNYLDGDEVQSGQMLSSETCLEALTETDQQAREEVAQKIQIIINAPVTPEDIPPFPSTESSKSARAGFLTGVAWQAVQIRKALSNPPSQV